MRKFRNLIPALILMVCIALSGCTTNTNTDSDETMPTLTYSVFATKAETQDGEQAVIEKLNEITRAKLGINLNLEIIETAQYANQMTVRLATDKNIDLLFVSPWLNSYSSLVSKNALLELDELLPTHAKEYYESIPAEWWDCARINGKIYAAINQQIFARQSMFVYLKEVAQETGFDYEHASKLEDLEQYFAKCIELGYNTKEYTLWENPGLMALMQYYGIDAIGGEKVPGSIRYHNDSAPVIFNQFETDEFKNFLRLVRNWNQKGYIAQDALSSTAEKTGIFKIDVCYKPGYSEVEMKNTFGAGKDVVFKPIGEPFLSTSNVIATMTAVSKQSKYPDKAVELINLFNTDKEIYNLICYGIEGIDYEKIDENYIKVVDKPKYSMRNNAWALGNQFNAYIQEGTEVGAWAKQDAFNHQAVPSDVLGFTFDAANVQTEAANCLAVINEYWEPLSVGLLDVDTQYPEFLNKLRLAGSEIIIAEMQRQLDEFISNRN